MQFPLPNEMVKVLKALRPALSDAVIIGGWAHRFHAEHSLATPTFEPLFTTDCDIALPLELAIAGPMSLEGSLSKEGFTCQLVGNEMGEGRRYVLDDQPEFYLQFLTRRQGDGRMRQAQEIGGVLAEPLRGINLALANSVEIDVPLGTSEIITVNVVSPVAFLVGKLIVSNQSNRGHNRAKDLLYVLDTFRLFENAIDELTVEASQVLSGLGIAQSRRLRNSIRTHFEGVGSPILHEAIELSSQAGGERPQSEEQFRSIIQYGIRLLLGEEWAPSS